MTTTATSWKKGDHVKLTTTTAGPELLEIVGFRRAGAVQRVVLADAQTAARIRNGEVDARIVVLTGIGGRVREIETQRFHGLTARGLAVHA
jgi:hypothetical protein